MSNEKAKEFIKEHSPLVYRDYFEDKSDDMLSMLRNQWVLSMLQAYANQENASLKEMIAVLKETEQQDLRRLKEKDIIISSLKERVKELKEGIDEATTMMSLGNNNEAFEYLLELLTNKQQSNE